MSDHVIVGKALNDLADEWHWVVLHNAKQVEPHVYLAQSVRTKCGLVLMTTPCTVTLYDMGAPDKPTCQRCLDADGGLSKLVIEQIMEIVEGVPA